MSVIGIQERESHEMQGRRARALLAVTSVDSLVELLASDSTRLTLHGVCREHRKDGRIRVQEVWVRGDLLRVEDPPGRLDTVIGDKTMWYFDPSMDRVTVRPRDPEVINPYTAPRILERLPAAFWRSAISNDAATVMSSIAERSLHGRDAVELAISGKSGPFQIVVDLQTGTWLEARQNGSPWLSWDRVTFDEPLSDALFSGNGAEHD